MKAAVIAYPEELLENNPQTVAAYRHKFCSIYIKVIQASSQGCGLFSALNSETSFFEKKTVGYSHRGSVRPDVYWQNEGVVFDFKFMDAFVRTEETHRWQEHLPRYRRYVAIAEGGT